MMNDKETRCKAFLDDLKSLLEKHNASLIDSDDYYISACLRNGSDDVYLTWKMNEDNAFELSADDVDDYIID